MLLYDFLNLLYEYELKDIFLKLNSTIQELGTQIHSLSSQCLEVEDLFGHDLQAKRLSLKDCCESLFNLSPKTYGTVAREKLWRLALYDAVSRARRIQKVSLEPSTLIAFLSAHSTIMLQANYTVSSKETSWLAFKKV